MGDSYANPNRVQLRDGRFLAYREGGVPKKEAKHKIIIVHGFQSSKNVEFCVSKELIEELGVYFVLYDRSGYGESDSNVKHSLKSEVDDIAELADHLELGPKFYLIGYSMGSYPAWGCLRHIPHMLSGVAFVAGTVNYKWPSLPENLTKTDNRRVFINCSLMISKYDPGLLNWWPIQKLILTAMAVVTTIAVYSSNRATEAHKRITEFPMNKQPERVVFSTIRDDFVSCYGQWDFDPADLSISEDTSVHIWHGKEDKLVPVQLQRCIVQKQPLIKYHEIPQAGHLIMEYDGIPDAIIRSLLLGEETKPV